MNKESKTIHRNKNTVILKRASLRDPSLLHYERRATEIAFNKRNVWFIKFSDMCIRGIDKFEYAKMWSMSKLQTHANKKQTLWPLVRKLTIPTERPPYRPIHSSTLRVSLICYKRSVKVALTIFRSDIPTNHGVHIYSFIFIHLLYFLYFSLPFTIRIHIREPDICRWSRAFQALVPYAPLLFLQHMGFSVGTATGYMLDGRGSIPAAARDFSSFHSVQIGFEAHQTSYPMRLGAFPGAKVAGAWN
jgi:hypothetical protein